MADPLAKQRRAGGPPDGEDAFIEAIYRSWAWIQDNARAVIVGLVLVGLGLFAFFYYRSYQQNLEERAAVELQDLRMAPVEDAQIAGELESFVRLYGGTEAGREGRLLLGRLYLGAGRHDEAAVVLEPVAGQPPDSPLGYAARLLRAKAFEGQGAVERALDELGTLGERARYGFQRRAARAERARILAETGRLEQAERIYAELVETTDNPNERAMYRIRLGEVRGMLAAGVPTGAEAESESEAAGEDDREPTAANGP